MADKCKVIEYLEGSLSDGGAETLVKDYCLLLDKKIFEPIILVDWIFKDSANYNRLKNSEVEIISLYPSYSIFWRIVNKYFRRQYITYKLRKSIKKTKPNVLHIHLAALKYVYAVRDQLNGVKLFYTCHSEPWFYFDNMPEEEACARKLIKENRLRLIALRPDMAETLNEKFGITNTSVIRNGIDFDRFKNLKQTRDEVRKSLSISLSSFVVGHIGRFNKEKNQSFLVDVFAEIKKKKHDSILLMIGVGDYEEKIRRKIRDLCLEDSVIILSHRTDIPELLHAMDVFVFPSLYEGFPIALLEVQAVGLRCIVSNTINSEVFLTDLVVPLSLNDSPEKWAETAVNPEIKGMSKNRLDEYDIRKSLKVLEHTYLGGE